MAQTVPEPRRLRPTSGKRIADTSTPKRRVFAPVTVAARRVGSANIWRPFRAVGQFIGRIIFPKPLRRSFSELRQVTWPNRKQTLQLTSAVIMFSVVFGVVVAIFDAGLDKLFKQVIIR